MTALARAWYRRLEAEGFDMSDLRRDTFEDDGVQYGRGKGHVSLDPVFSGGFDAENSRRFGDPTDVFSLADAVYWRAISEAVDALPRTYPGRALLRAWAESGYVVEAARACRVSRWYARRTVEKFIERQQHPRKGEPNEARPHRITSGKPRAQVVPSWPERIACAG